VSEGIAKGLYVVEREGFEPATLIELTTEPSCPPILMLNIPHHMSGAAFCCEGRFFGLSGPFGYYAAKGLFGCGSISME